MRVYGVGLDHRSCPLSVRERVSATTGENPESELSRDLRGPKPTGPVVLSMLASGPYCWSAYAGAVYGGDRGFRPRRSRSSRRENTQSRRSGHLSSSLLETVVFTNSLSLSISSCCSRRISYKPWMAAIATPSASTVAMPLLLGPRPNAS